MLDLPDSDTTFVVFDDLRAFKAEEASASAQERKCGTCRFFQVRPNEVDIARIARPMNHCQPGRNCFGGPVRGICLQWRRRGASTPQMESTQVCPLYEPGGPTILGRGPAPVVAGSASRAPGASSDASGGATLGGAALALGGAFALAIVPAVVRTLREGWGGSR